jgi:hypothetical protein
MSIHCVHLQVDKDATAALVQGTTGFIAVWLNNFTAWTNPNQENRNVELTNTDPDGESGLDYYESNLWRFEWSADKANLLDNLEGHVAARSNWYRIRWHECDHDEDARGGCSWDEIRTGGTVPDEVPG